MKTGSGFSGGFDTTVKGFGAYRHLRVDSKKGSDHIIILGFTVFGKINIFFYTRGGNRFPITV